MGGISVFAHSFSIINRVKSPGQPVVCIQGHKERRADALPHRPLWIKVALYTTEALRGPMVPQTFSALGVCRRTTNVFLAAT